jgi:hypothetical protein
MVDSVTHLAVAAMACHCHHPARIQQSAKSKQKFMKYDCEHASKAVHDDYMGPIPFSKIISLNDSSGLPN